MISIANSKDHFHNITLKKIINVYVLTDKNGKKTPGFGDFLKSCIFLLQLCNALGLEFDVDFKNHPISCCLKNENQKEIIDYSQIEYPEWGGNNYIDKHGLHCFIQHLNTIQKDTFHLFTNGWLKMKSDNNSMQIIRSKFSFTPYFQTKIDTYMHQLRLEPRRFIIIHIRFNDAIFNNNTVGNTNMQSAIKKINFLLKNNRDKIHFIISNSNKIKYKISKYGHSNVCFAYSKIVHLGGESISHNNSTKITDTQAIVDTLTDFFMMTKSSTIISLSEYEWGSCFSEMASCLYGVPLIKMRI